MVRLSGPGLLVGLLLASWSDAAGAVLEPHVAAYRLSLAGTAGVAVS